jgi:hypothetical protein
MEMEVYGQRIIGIFELLEFFLRGQKKGESDGDIELKSSASQQSALAEKKLMNILESFKIIIQTDFSLIHFIPSIHCAVYVMPLLVNANSVTVSTPVLYYEHYHLQVGLSYVAISFGGILGSIGWGNILHRDWQIVDQRYNETGNKKPKDHTDLMDFPLEVARTRTIWYPLIAFLGMLRHMRMDNPI